MCVCLQSLLGMSNLLGLEKVMENFLPYIGGMLCAGQV